VLPSGVVDVGNEQARALEGTTLGKYRIERLLGEGAMGEVFLATHVDLGRPVALKTLKPQVAADRSLTERFFAEARAVNIIRHENIVECTDLVNDPTARSYIVMELLEGMTLGAAIEQVGRIPARRAARIVAQIADAIGAAHDKGIVHRDLKPENVFLIKRAGSTDYVKVLDFGIARLRPDLGVSATQSGALIGTPAYMSPEQVRGEKAGPSSDIYALGAILFHMLTGRMPFVAQSMSLMLVAQLQETPARVDKLAPEVPRALADVVARALSKEPAQRPATMAAFRREALEAVGLSSDPGSSLADSSPVLVRPGTDPASVAPTVLPSSAGQSSISASAGQVIGGPAKRSRTWLFAVGGLAVIGGIVAIVALGGSKDDKTLVAGDPPAPITSEPPKIEPPKIEPAKTEPPRIEPAKTDPPKTESPKTEPPKTEPPPKTVQPKVAPDDEKLRLERARAERLRREQEQNKRVEADRLRREQEERERLRKEANAKPPDPALDCSLASFMRVYQSCSDKTAVRPALGRLNRCQSESKLPPSIDYDVVKSALLKCM
jgi:serine/threonine protein kinase